MRRRDLRYQAAIIHDHQVLLVRTVERDGATFWVPPGGGREGEETAEDCVCREALEETALIVAVERLLFAEPGLAGSIYDHRHTYLCQVLGGTATPGVVPELDTAEHSFIREIGWFDLCDPGSWPLPPVMKLFTLDWLQRLRATLGYR